MQAFNTDAALQEALEPLRQQMAMIETEITQLEERLRDRRNVRTNVGRALIALDPQWAADHRPKGKKSKGGPRMSDEKLEKLRALIRERGPNADLSAPELAPALGLATSTLNPALSYLADQGFLRLDRMGGQRGTTKFYRYTGQASE